MCVLVTFTASFAVACILKISTDVIPVLGMRIETDGPAPGAVAVEADIPFRVAGLAGGKGTTSLPGVTDRPCVEIRSDRALQVAAIALQGIVQSGMDCVDIGVYETKVETAAMRWAADIIASEMPRIVTVAAETGLVTADATVPVCPCRDRVADCEVTAMHVDHVVAEGSHFMCKTGFVTIETFRLFMAGCTIGIDAFGQLAVIQSPDRTMSQRFRQGDLIDHLFIVTIQANGRIRYNGIRFLNVTGHTIGIGDILLNMGLVIEIRSPERGNRRRQ